MYRFSGFTLTRQFLQAVLRKHNYFVREKHGYKRVPVSVSPRLQNIGHLALGIGLGSAVVLTGTALVAKYNLNFRQNLLDNVRIFESVLTPVEETTSTGNSINTITSIGNTIVNLDDDNSTELKNANLESSEANDVDDLISQKDNQMKNLSNIQELCELMYIAALSTNSLAAQSVGVLAGDIDKYALDTKAEGYVPSSASDKILLQLLLKSREVQNVVNDAESTMVNARTHLNLLRKNLSELCCLNNTLPEEIIEHIRSTLSDQENSLNFAESFLKQALESSSIQRSTLQNHVAKIIKYLKDELGFSFENSDNPEQKEIYLAALSWQLIQYRKEMEYAKRLQEKVTNELLGTKGVGANEKRLNAVLQSKENAIRQSLQEENNHQIYELRKKLETDIKQRLFEEKLIINKTHKEKLRLERVAFDRELSEQLEQAYKQMTEKCDEFIEVLNNVSPNLPDIELKIKMGENALKLVNLSHILSESLKISPFPQLSWQHQLQPLLHIVEALHETETHVDDAFVHTVVSSIPNIALHRGVFTLSALKSRFNQIETTARRVTMLKRKEGNSLLAHLLSYVGSAFLVHPVSQVSVAEKDNVPVDLDTMSNDAILDRAKFFIQQGDIRQAVCYMNMLQGVAQHVSSEWLKEATLYLEVLQVAEVLNVFSSLVVDHLIN